MDFQFKKSTYQIRSCQGFYWEETHRQGVVLLFQNRNQGALLNFCVEVLTLKALHS